MSLDHENELVKHQTPTLDAFLGGRLTLSQPRSGFRAGLDSVLLGAAIGSNTRLLLDLGAGVGTAGLVGLVHAPEAKALFVERDLPTAELARSNILQNGFSDRAQVVTIDLLAPAMQREAAGLLREGYDTAIFNPPYYADGRDSAANPERRAARQMASGQLDDWFRVAASHLVPGGTLIAIHTAEALPRILAAAGARFGDIDVLPLVARSGATARRVLVRCRKGTRGPFRLLASRVLHLGDGRAFAPEFDAIFKGNDRLHW